MRAFLICSAVAGYHMLLGWLFVEVLRGWGWLALPFAVGCLIYVGLTARLLTSALAGLAVFGCGVAGFLAGFGLIMLASLHATGYQVLAGALTGLMLVSLFFAMRWFGLTAEYEGGPDLTVYPFIGYLAAEAGAFVRDELVEHWAWWKVTLILLGGLALITYNIVRDNDDGVFLPN